MKRALSTCSVPWGLCAALILAAGCTEPSEPPTTTAVPGPPWFEPCADTTGLDFTHVAGRSPRYELPEIMSGGGALFDMDDDGDLDAYLVQSGDYRAAPAERPGNRLFRNRLVEDGRLGFEDVTAGSGADDRGYGMGVATGDCDGDGDLDLYVTNVGPNVLLRNDGVVDGRVRFTDITADAGVGHEGWGAGATFLDADGDGDLDLFATNYLVWTEQTRMDCYNPLGGRDYCSPQAIDAPARDVLYRNDGAVGGSARFTDVTDTAGLGDTRGTGLGVVAADFDDDGRPDLFVANDGMADRLWMNRGGRDTPIRFEDEALAMGCAVDEDGAPKAGMGLAVADLDEDGRTDVLVGNLTGQSDSLYLNRGSYFLDATTRMGLAPVSRPYTRFGMALTDLDNDGRLDLYVANGRVTRAEKTLADDIFAEPNLLLRGTPEGRFAAVDPRGGVATPLIATSRAAAFGDVDGDGGVDVLVVNNDGKANLLRNVAASRGRWIVLRVVNEHGGDALGAHVAARIGDRLVVREVRTGSSYLAAGDPRIHIGLGDADRVDEVVVRWPDGHETRHGPFAADAVVTIER